MDDRLLAKIREITKSRRISRSFDRKVLLKTVFSAILNQTGRLSRGRTALWIGCRLYTRDYYAAIERDGAIVKTIDIDRTATAYGRRGAHTIGSATELTAHYATGAFDVIFCNGVIGWGIDAPGDRLRCYREMRAVMKPGSLLVLGWNTHRSPDPLFNGDIEGLFSPVAMPGLSSRMLVPSTTHVFDMLSPVAEH